METVAKVKCVSIKKKQNYDVAHPIGFEIEFDIPYDPKSIYYQMSGGTKPTLNTVNEEAAQMFEIGKDYKLSLSPWIE